MYFIEERASEDCLGENYGLTRRRKEETKEEGAKEALGLANLSLRPLKIAAAYVQAFWPLQVLGKTHRLSS